MTNLDNPAANPEFGCTRFVLEFQRLEITPARPAPLGHEASPRVQEALGQISAKIAELKSDFVDQTEVE